MAMLHAESPDEAASARGSIPIRNSKRCSKVSFLIREEQPLPSILPEQSLPALTAGT